MNRETKSRAIRIDNGEWIYGDSCLVGDKRYIIRRETAEIINYCPSIPQEILGVAFAIEVHPDTVGQYWGKDDDGKEIYDGSLITFIPKDASTLVQQIAEVYYCEKRQMTCVKSSAWDCPLFNCAKIQVIGTIHDKEQQ